MVDGIVHGAARAVLGQNRVLGELQSSLSFTNLRHIVGMMRVEPLLSLVKRDAEPRHPSSQQVIILDL